MSPTLLNYIKSRKDKMVIFHRALLGRAKHREGDGVEGVSALQMVTSWVELGLSPGQDSMNATRLKSDGK